jgi:hypothetical protein
LAEPEGGPAVAMVSWVAIVADRFEYSGGPLIQGGIVKFLHTCWIVFWVEGQILPVSVEPKRQVRLPLPFGNDIEIVYKSRNFVNKIKKSPLSGGFLKRIFYSS